jgi:hypothetical protein
MLYSLLFEKCRFAYLLRSWTAVPRMIPKHVSWAAMLWAEAWCWWFRRSSDIQEPETANEDDSGSEGSLRI